MFKFYIESAFVNALINAEPSFKKREYNMCFYFLEKLKSSNIHGRIK